ncbi:hypothetical protein MA16_Dca027829 [Dendrobium catenatum]|uniref:Uncharacterized protein n=1 Tax=Dendrobium catenatum TaxID=906689 RepID=A0A2I0VFU3_9ASPA|nr:hypothetical protein MA16_Dca027829 [Dendrobium catenatum]
MKLPGNPLDGLWAIRITSCFLLIPLSTACYAREQFLLFLCAGFGSLCARAEDQVGIANIVHIYIFPAKPYELMGDRLPGIVLGDYASMDCPFDPDESHAVEPMKKGLTRFNEKLHKISQNIKKQEKDRRRIKDDSVIGSSSPSRRVIRGIDDPLLNGTVSNSSVFRGRRHCRKSVYNSADSGGEHNSDHSFGGYEIRGCRWITKD